MSSHVFSIRLEAIAIRSRAYHLILASHRKVETTLRASSVNHNGRVGKLRGKVPQTGLSLPSWHANCKSVLVSHEHSSIGLLPSSKETSVPRTDPLIFQPLEEGLPAEEYQCVMKVMPPAFSATSRSKAKSSRELLLHSSYESISRYRTPADRQLLLACLLALVHRPYSICSSECRLPTMPSMPSTSLEVTGLTKQGAGAMPRGEDMEANLDSGQVFNPFMTGLGINGSKVGNLCRRGWRNISKMFRIRCSKRVIKPHPKLPPNGE